MHSLTVNVNRAVGRASINEALSRGVHGGEVCPDQSSQHFVASVGHQAVILRMLDQVVPGWILFPTVVPAYQPQSWTDCCSKLDGHDTDTDCRLYMYEQKAVTLLIGCLIQREQHT